MNRDELHKFIAESKGNESNICQICVMRGKKQYMKIRKTTIALILILIFALTLPCGCGKQSAQGLKQEAEPAPESQTALHLRLEREDWAEDVKTALNDFLSMYGVDSDRPAESPYVVFDFDNTCSIFDVEEQLAVYQLQVMAFAIKPEELKGVLLTDLIDPDKDLSDYGYGKGSLNDWADDICAAYTELWESYGPFTPTGVSAQQIGEMQADPQWQEFSAKMRAMYSLVYDAQSADVAYPWVTYWFTGMTEDEVYALSLKAFAEYKDVETSEVIWTSPESIKSKAGVVSINWISGIQVTENINELWRALNDNGIDVWVCSASCTGAIRAAIDTFGLRDYCRGMLAMTNCMDDSGRYLPRYDAETGCGFYADKNGSWTRMSRPTKAQTQGAGKVTAIVNAVAPEYEDHGPIAGFMDSTGDFNFCTEFRTLKLVVCFNRANRKVTDGGGLIAEVAMYEKDTLGYDLATANATGDTLYLLQGRDENGKRSLRNSNCTIRLGSAEESLFKNNDNEIQLQRMIDESMTVVEILNSFAIKQEAGENGFAFRTGFLTEYAGYHSRE